MSKIFCIGFHKTGTTSLANALEILGYTVTGPNGVHDPYIERNVLPMAFELVAQYDAFQDNPWPIIYRELDERYPGSRFILTVRDPDAWIRSQVRHFGRTETPMRQWIYGVGCPQGNETIYLQRYLAHNQDVRDYFKDRSQDLLVLDITRGDGWQPLCTFLDIPVPDVPFPHRNRAAVREAAVKKPTVGGRLNHLGRRVGRRVRRELRRILASGSNRDDS